MKKLIPMLCGFCLASAFQATAPAQTITNQPQSLTVNNASTATFSVGASNATSYQWVFNGANNLSDGTNLSDGVIITGSTNSALTLEGVTSNEAGSYTVIVNGSVTSSPPAVLTIVPGTIVTFTFSGILGGGTTNVQVQLFNYDKPVTVQNFLHYITAGAYTNMFFDRCLPGFVLQGGDYGASNQTMATPPITGWSIYQQFTLDDTIEPPFPSQITNEFNVGPLLHNRFGTIAMALLPSDPNSASSAFFFNLADNSAGPNDLDTTNNGPFTVFGRVISETNVLNGGTNVLNYFNALASGGVAANGEIVYDESLMTNPLASLPVNYIGANVPANSNLVFCAFQLTSPPGATNPPSVSMTSPRANAVQSADLQLTVLGTAVDTNNIGLAWVRCDLIPLPAPDDTLPNGGVSLTNYVLGSTNWSLNFGTVAPGMYELGAQVQDLASNLSPEVFVQPVIITAIVTNGYGTVTFTNGTFTDLNAVGYPFQIGSNYNLVATPGSNQLFVSWTVGDQGLVTPELPLPTYNGLVFTATFISNGIPNSIAFTYPPANAIISTDTFNITGTISNVASTPVTITCYIYSADTYFQAAVSPLTTTGSNSWSITVSNLPMDSYALESTATDSSNNSTVITENFSVEPQAPLQLNIVGSGTVSPVTNGELIVVGTQFQVTATTTNAGQLFYTWSDGTAISLNATQTYTMIPGLTLTATFLTNNNPSMIAFTYPMANGIIGQIPFDITGTISNVSSPPVTVTCQIFSNSDALMFSEPLTASGTNNWAIGVSGLAAGSYTLEATAFDAAGDSTLIGENFMVQNLGALQLVIVGKGTVAPITNGESLPIGENFAVTAIPGSGQAFYTWNNGTQISANAMQTYTMAPGLTLTATFVPSNTAKGISFTYPPANARLSTNSFPLKGRIAPSFKPARITCQIFQTNGLGVGSPMTTSGTTTWSVTATNIPGGIYVVEAAASNEAGMSTIISENFLILPCAAVAGTYSGLFISTNNPAPTNSGFLTFTVEPSGIYSGKMVFPAYAPLPIYSLVFTNIDFVFGVSEFSLPSFYGNPLSGSIFLDFNSGSDVAYGTISSAAWSSQLICYRAVTKLAATTTPAPGKYILSLQPANQTNGLATNGYASLAVAKNGAMALSGALPDNTTFSQSPRVSKDGVWPLYAVPAGDGNNGMLIGWETNSSPGSCSGQLYWYKAPNVGAYDMGGIGVVSNMLLNATGTNFVRPAAGSQYSIVFEGGTIVPPLTNTLTVTNAGQFVAAGSPADNLKISLSANGVITGSILNTNDNMTLRFKGAFISPAQGGSGFIPEAGGKMGCFELQVESQ